MSKKIKIVKNNSKITIKDITLLTMLCIGLYLIIPVDAMAAFGTKTNTLLQIVIAGLRIMGATVATLTLLWAALMFLTGQKTLRDLTPWIIGAILFASATEIVNIFFT